MGVAADLGSAKRFRRSDRTPRSVAPAPPAAPRGVPGGVGRGLALGVLPRDALRFDQTLASDRCLQHILTPSLTHVSCRRSVISGVCHSQESP